jgi:hypothetical protein
MTLFVKTLTGTITYYVDPSTTVGEVKCYIERREGAATHTHTRGKSQ